MWWNFEKIRSCPNLSRKDSFESSYSGENKELNISRKKSSPVLKKPLKFWKCSGILLHTLKNGKCHIAIKTKATLFKFWININHIFFNKSDENWTKIFVFRKVILILHSWCAIKKCQNLQKTKKVNDIAGVCEKKNYARLGGQTVL